MPVRPTVPSLKLCVIQYIGKNFNKICYGVDTQVQMNELVETDQYKNTLGPFRTWPARLLEDLYDVLCRKRCSSSYLNILIQPQIRNFKVQPGTIHYAIGYLQQRCPKLETFELTSSIDIVPDFFINVFLYFPHLVKINLSGNVIDDRSFETIGVTCQKLQHLNVSGSTISGCGLKFISKSNQNVPRCKKLQHLNILKTILTKEDVASFLYFHPLVTDVHYEDTIGALAALEILKKEHNCKLQFRAMGCSEVTDYKVKVLSCNEKRDINLEFSHALNENPDFEGLKIANSHFRISSLSQITRSQNLHSLEIGNNDTFSIDFKKGIAPILTSCGISLKKLVLDKYRFVDIELIGKFCKKLEILGLSHIITYGRLQNICKSSFCKLEELDFTNEYGCPIVSKVLKQLLFFSKNLQYLHLQRIDCLDDVLWSQALSKNKLTNLISLTLDQCHSISGDLVADVIEYKNSLQILNIWSCRFITNLNKEAMKKAICRENFDMCFRCLPFMGYVTLPLPPIGLGNDEQSTRETVEADG